MKRPGPSVRPAIMTLPPQGDCTGAKQSRMTIRFLLVSVFRYRDPLRLNGIGRKVGAARPLHKVFAVLYAVELLSVLEWRKNLRLQIRPDIQTQLD